MMRDRLRARAARRQQRGGARGQETDIQLPLRGVFNKAKTGKVSNLYASELLNWRSDGISLKLRPGITWAGGLVGVLQRVPFEFGATPHYIELRATQAKAGFKIRDRAFNGRAMWATNSGNVIIADGLDLPLRYDGDAFRTAVFTAAAGPDPATCDGIISHHDRIYLWKTGGALEFLVGDVGAVQGPMTLFPLGRLGNITGSMLAMVSLTIDAGHGMNDVLCIITSTGQLVLYEGLDPNDAQDWRLLGRIKMAAPVGKDVVAKVGSDAWVLTTQGPVSIGQAVRESVLALVSEVSIPICDEIKALVDQGPADWQMMTADDGTMVVINRVKDGAALQYIYYMESRAWSTANFPAKQWHNLNGKPQITGLDGILGSLVTAGSSEMITGRWVSSWFTVGGEVSVNYIEPTIIAGGPLTVRVVVLSDQQDRPADITEAQQTITLEAEESGGGRVTLSDIIPTDASGKSFQITLEVTATWAEITGLKASIGS